MIIAHEAGAIPPGIASAVTVGTFDGVHLGHRMILDRLSDISRSAGLRSVVLTFDPHPRSVLGNGAGGTRVLTSIDERLALLEASGVDLTLVVRFTQEFSKQRADEFVGRWLVGNLNANHVIVGHDHHFGNSRQGGVAELERLGMEKGFAVDQVGPMELEGSVISSSRIRTAIEGGNIEQANRLLGYRYAFAGDVIHGDRRGAGIGFPTANLSGIDAGKVMPGRGVYAVHVTGNGVSNNGMMNIGVRPTIGEGLTETREIHLFGYEGELYGSRLTVRVVSRLREERRFASLEELVAQLRLDRQEAMRRLNV
jgi:riboflavin kinase/FMN adenylyltransferase